MIYKIIIIFFISLNSVFSSQTAFSGAQDSRIKHIAYDPNNVVKLLCHYDITTFIEYANDEVIISSDAGNRSAWSVKRKESRTNLLTILPKAKNANTNLIVVTNKRIYSYDLIAKEKNNSSKNDITYVVRYTYPEEENKLMEARALLRLQQENMKKNMESKKKENNDIINPLKINTQYSYSGDKSISPISVYDNDIFTYFVFDKNTDLPAIYAVDSDRSESMVNHHMENDNDNNTDNDIVVVEQLAKRFTLRSGNHVTTVIRGRHAKENLTHQESDNSNSTPRWWK